MRANKPRKMLHNLGSHAQKMKARRVVQRERQSYIVYGYVRPRNAEGRKYTGPFVYISKPYPLEREYETQEVHS